VSPTLRDRGLTYAEKKPVPAAGTKPKDLIGIPWMVAFALRADGWYLRSDIIWSKPNPMPESVTDRPTKSHEYVFLLSKGPRYFYDADAIREAHDGPLHAPGNQAADEWEGIRGAHKSKGMSGHLAEPERTWGNPAGRNKRSVWTVATQPYPGAHFATFPPKLIEPCILAGCPERACGVCGAPWTRVVERTPMVVRPTAKREAWQAEDDHARTQTGGTMLEPPSSRTVGWEPSCAHDAPTVPGTVLDPFAGAGTTGMVALRHGPVVRGYRTESGVRGAGPAADRGRRAAAELGPRARRSCCSEFRRAPGVGSGVRVPDNRSHRRVLSCLPHPRFYTRRCCGRSRRESLANALRPVQAEAYALDHRLTEVLISPPGTPEAWAFELAEIQTRLWGLSDHCETARERIAGLWGDRRPRLSDGDQCGPGDARGAVCQRRGGVSGLVRGGLRAGGRRGGSGA
jgi:hypothetical protein